VQTRLRANTFERHYLLQPTILCQPTLFCQPTLLSSNTSDIQHFCQAKVLTANIITFLPSNTLPAYIYASQHFYYAGFLTLIICSSQLFCQKIFWPSNISSSQHFCEPIFLQTTIYDNQHFCQPLFLPSKISESQQLYLILFMISVSASLWPPLIDYQVTMNIVGVRSTLLLGDQEIHSTCSIMYDYFYMYN
jgi:hypothetical protein